MEGNTIGQKIKQFREFRNISTEEFSLRTNLDLDKIELIEEKGVVPSLGTLIKIARGLGVRIGTFLDDNEQIGPVVVKAGHEKKSSRFSSKNESDLEHLNFYSLAQDHAGRHMEPFIVDIEPYKKSDYLLSSHEGEEFILVMEGSIEINYGKDLHLLEKGDSIYFDSIVDHNVHAANNKPAKILAVVYVPV